MNGPAMIRAAIEAAEPFKPGPETIEDCVTRLVALPPPDYDQVRKIEAERLGIRVRTLDVEVDKARRKIGGGNTAPRFLDDLNPWPVPANGCDLLNQLTAVIQRHLVLPFGAAETIALWLLFSHAHDCFDISPILAVTSPTPECGKTTLMTMLGALVPRALPASHITTAALFRSIDKWCPTLLIDEADTFLSGNDDLRGVLNSGHHRANAHVIRTTGDDHEPRPFSTWAPKAFALIGKLEATLASRSIHIELRRMTASEKVEQLRLDRLDHLEPLKRQATRWAKDNAVRLRSADTEMPITLYGRAADNLRPLIAIADLAGGNWPSRAREIAELLGGRRNEQTAGIMLLEDIQHIFAERGEEKLSSADLVAVLALLEERPWPEWRQGRPITPSQLAKLLAPFGVRPMTIRVAGEGTIKGYKFAAFEDAFTRYLERDAVTPSQPAETQAAGADRTRHTAPNVTAEVPTNPADAAECDGVTATMDSAGSEDSRMHRRSDVRGVPELPDIPEFLRRIPKLAGASDRRRPQ